MKLTPLMKNTITLLCFLFIYMLIFGCGKEPIPTRTIVVEQDNGELYGYIHCKSTSATTVTYCTIPGQAEVDEILDVDQFDANSCAIGVNIGVYNGATLWVKELCNGWVTYRVRDYD